MRQLWPGGLLCLEGVGVLELRRGHLPGGLGRVGMLAVHAGHLLGGGRVGLLELRHRVAPGTIIVFPRH